MLSCPLDQCPQLCQLRRLNYPVTNTLMGLGGYPATDRQFVGMLGMHGTYEANLAMHGCDTMICIGARFDDRITGRVDAAAAPSGAGAGTLLVVARFTAPA